MPTLTCAEDLEYKISKNDKFGFKNPNEVYKKPIDLIILGDSYAEGWCYNEKDDVAGLLRKKNINSLNFGVAGAGPILSLAVMREYVKNFNPRYLLYFYCESNDLMDLDIEKNNYLLKHTSLSHEFPRYDIKKFKANKNASEWVIDMIITDNEAASVQNALSSLKFNVDITRQVHWEIVTAGGANDILKEIESSGELFNSNKEFISVTNQNENTVSFLVRQKEDIHSISKLESLRKRFDIDGIVNLRRGVIWNVTVMGGNFETVINDILDTHIFFNPLSHECYRIS